MEQYIRFHCSRKDEFAFRVRYAFSFSAETHHFEASNLSEILFASSGEGDKSPLAVGNNLRSAVELCDRQHSWTTRMGRTLSIDSAYLLNDIAKLGGVFDECVGFHNSSNLTVMK